MKHHHRRTKRTVNRTYCPPYPNAAEPEYFTKKAQELLTAAVSGFGMVFAMLSLMLLG